MFQGKTVGVVVPCHNEETQIGTVIETMPACVDRIIIVDDVSSDRTVDVVGSYAAKDPGRIRLVRHPKNGGVGAAIVTGYKAAVEERIDMTAVMAGDAQMDPDDLPSLLAPVAAGDVDYAKGNRLFTGDAWNAIPRTRYLGNSALSLMTKVASGYWHVADSQTGYCVANLHALETIDLDALYPRYGFPNDMLVQLNIYDFRVRDVPIKPIYDVGEKSGIKALPRDPDPVVASAPPFLVSHVPEVRDSRHPPPGPVLRHRAGIHSGRFLLGSAARDREGAGQTAVGPDRGPLVAASHLRAPVPILRHVVRHGAQQGSEVTDASGAGPLRVVSVTTSYPRGESDHAGHFVHSLARELVVLGCEVTVLAPHAPGLPLEEVRDGVRVRRFRYAPDFLERVAYGDGIPSNLRRDPLAVLALPAFALGLRRAVRELAHDADVVHVNWAPTAALAGRALAGMRVALTLHGSDTTLARSGRVWRGLLRRGVARATRVIAVSAEQVDFLRSESLWSGPVDVIPAGVSAALPDRSRPKRDPETPFTFLFTGRMLESKGVRELLDAFAALLSAGRDARLVFTLGGPEEASLRERAAAAGVLDRIAFHGAVSPERALELIACADCSVLPSWGEGSPVSVVEALALGTPVIGTRVGAMPELLGEDGLLVGPRDPAALLTAMARALDDSALLARLSALGRERVRRRYTWPAVAAATLRVLTEAARE